MINTDCQPARPGDFRPSESRIRLKSGHGPGGIDNTLPVHKVLSQGGFAAGHAHRCDVDPLPAQPGSRLQSEVDLRAGGHKDGILTGSYHMGTLPDRSPVYDEEQYVFEALRAGARGYLLKRITPDELVTALQGVLAGEIVVDPLLSDKVAKAAAESSGRGLYWPGMHYGLTKREAEVLQLGCQGFSNREIAEQTVVGEDTQDPHQGHLPQAQRPRSSGSDFNGAPTRPRQMRIFLFNLRRELGEPAISKILPLRIAAYPEDGRRGLR